MEIQSLSQIGHFIPWWLKKNKNSNATYCCKNLIEDVWIFMFSAYTVSQRMYSLLEVLLLSVSSEYYGLSFVAIKIEYHFLRHPLFSHEHFIQTIYQGQKVGVRGRL